MAPALNDMQKTMAATIQTTMSATRFHEESGRTLPAMLMSVWIPINKVVETSTMKLKTTIQT